ncbi:MAG: FG-GAP repeat protein [candidate division Zixibacteria bacterium]|nr:FG-GAP repeat protein [candidate division Zixibacteria bacterium]
MLKRLLVFVCLISILPFGSALCDCDPVRVINGEADEDHFGMAVAGIDDVDDDGVGDFLVGAFTNDAAEDDAGRVYLYSGVDGYLIRTFSGHGVNEEFGYAVADAGDVDSDGYPDIAVGAPTSEVEGPALGKVYVYSGQNGALLYEFDGERHQDQFGISVAGAGDVNNDGFDDVIVGAIFYDNDADSAAGRAYVFSGADGATLLVFDGEDKYNRFGFAVAGAGDINRDGYDDVIVGAPYNSANGNKAGRAYVFSGVDGSKLYHFTGLTSDGYHGYAVTGVGDVNKDGYPDVMVGAPYVYSRNGRVYVYSGLDGSVLYTFYGNDQERLGRAVADIGDMNHDGYPDLAMSSNGNDLLVGKVYIYSGKDGELLNKILGDIKDNQFGLSIGAISNVDPEGNLDLVVGIPWQSTAGYRRGQAQVYHAWVPCVCCEGFTGNVDCSELDSPDIADITRLIDYLYLSHAPLCCPEEADTDGNFGEPDISDITRIINFLYLGGMPPVFCP